MREPQSVARPMSVEEYFDLEENSEFKHELWWGEPVAMAGALRQHNTLTAQISYVLNGRLEGTPCQAVTSDQRVALGDDNYVYPDVVWCEDAQWDETRGDTLLTPIFIVEVLSPGTQLRDRREKLDAYRDLPSLRDYLMVSPERVSIDHYSRADESEIWSNRRTVRRAQRVRLETLDIEIEVAELYRRLSVPEGLRSVREEQAS